MNLAKPAIGFFGKVSSHGDFVSRRFSEQVRNAWDEWAQSGMAASKQQLAEDWLPTYLTSPVWRFCLNTGVMDEHCWTGVFMPSVDRVGRYFPLIIAAIKPGKVNLLEWMSQSKDWLDAVELLALSSLQIDFRIDEFDLALRQLPIFTTDEQYRVTGTLDYRWSLSSLDRLPDAIPQLTHQIAGQLLAGHSLWWTEGSERVTPSVLLCRGLPSAIGFTALFNGDWQQYGWHNLTP